MLLLVKFIFHVVVSILIDSRMSVLNVAPHMNPCTGSRSSCCSIVYMPFARSHDICHFCCVPWSVGQLVSFSMGFKVEKFLCFKPVVIIL